LFALFTGFLLAGSPVATAAETTLLVEVAAGKHARERVVVSTPVDLPAQFGPQSSVSLEGPGGIKTVGQLTAPSLLSDIAQKKDGRFRGELHFTISKLAAGETLKLTATIGDEPTKEQGFSWRDEPGKFSLLSYGEIPVLKYMYERVDNSSKERRMETYKVYHHLYGEDGAYLMTKGPGGLYPHHRGLYYGFNRITYGDGAKADVWHCNKGESQTHEGFISHEGGPVLGRHRMKIAWRGADGETFATELREMTVSAAGVGGLVEFASVLETTDGKIHLDGDPQHAGFQFRASQHVAEKTKGQTYYIRPDGVGEPGQFRNWPANKEHVNLPWNGMSIVVHDDRYLLGYLDRPSNPKEARFSERNYGRFGSYFTYDVTEEKPLKVNYQVYFQALKSSPDAGTEAQEELTHRSQNFVDPPEVRIVK